MLADSAPTNLTNHFLIAMPGLEDALFTKSVVYLVDHGERGAMGLVINKAGDMTLPALFNKIDLTLQRDDLTPLKAMQGGPVHPDRGFVLHEPLYPDLDRPEPSPYASTMTIPGGLEMTTSRDVLEAIASGGGPRKVMITLGYAAWGSGQLESEIKENTWLAVPACQTVIFEVPLPQRYDQALALLGLESWMIAPQAGNA